jgi:DNA modification methylase
MKTIEIEKLRLAEYNPRQITDDEMNKLKKSLKEFGFIQPVVVNKDFTVISGHQRIRAWKEMDKKDVPVIFLDITKKKEKALNLAMNKISGSWDTEKLYDMINELSITEEIELTGFEDKEISTILDNFRLEEEQEEKTVEEAIEEAPTRAKLGDVYQLGNHRLMCGDSTDMLDIKKLIGENKMDMVWTDPPYNVNYESMNKALGSIKNDHMNVDNFNDFIQKVFANLSAVTKQGGVFYVCSGWQSFAVFENKLRESGVHISEVIIWVKNTGGIATIEYPHKHEQIIKARKTSTPTKKKAKAIFYGWKKGKHAFYGDGSDYDVWDVDKKSSSKYVHPTEKPDWLVMKALKNSTKFNDKVIDLFGGSGSCLMASEKLGRKSFSMELDPRFVDVILYRWESYTKQEAIKI